MSSLIVEYHNKQNYVGAFDSHAHHFTIEISLFLLKLLLSVESKSFV